MKQTKISKPEIMAPAGNWPMLIAALDAGADAVYFGTTQLNMRTMAKNFEIQEIKKIVQECHKRKAKAYLTLNTIVYENEREKIKKIIKTAKEAKVDAIVCWDFFVIDECKKQNMPFTISTQASVANYDALKHFAKLGTKKVNLARELSLSQIKEISEKRKKDKLDIKIESFVHGAMCVSVSGRCFLSQEMFGKSANRGECMQPCRRPYKVVNEETGNELVVGNNYILSPKDLCALPFIDKLIEAGIDVFKIEGRNRSPEYVKVVVTAYRKVIDNYAKNKKLDKKLVEQQLLELKKVYNRDFSAGFLLGMPTSDDFTNKEGSSVTEIKEYVGFVRNYYAKIKVAEIKIENKPLSIGNEIYVIGNKTGVFRQKVKSMEISHKKVESAAKGQRIAIKTDKEVRPNDKIFRIVKVN